MTFDLPPNKDYHLIATEPVIDNIRVVHQMRLLGCTDEVPEWPSPRVCYTPVRGCEELLGVWTVGMAGQCMSKDAGFRVGATRFKTVLLEIHWNNPDLRDDSHDASGLRIYLSPRLRPHDAGILWTGQGRLFLPPGQSRVTVTGTCPAKCTQRHFKQTIHVTNALNHMHYLGISEKVEHLRNRTRVQYFTNEEFNRYDSPMFNTFEPPLTVKPGDSLKTTCVYRTLSTRVTTVWGKRTQDETCYAIIVYYPRSAVTRVSFDSWGDYNACMVDKDKEYNGCRVCNFQNQTDPDTRRIVDKVLKHCDAKHGRCRPECKNVAAEVKKHPCMLGDLGDSILHETVEEGAGRGAMFADALQSCDGNIGVNSDGRRYVVSTLIICMSLLSGAVS